MSLLESMAKDSPVSDEAKKKAEALAKYDDIFAEST